MEPLTQPYFGKAIPAIPAPTKMRVVLNEHDPIYSHTLGRDPEAMMSAAKQNPVKPALTLITEATLVDRVPRARTPRKWLTYVVVLSFVAVATLFFMPGPKTTNDERPSTEPYFWDGNGSPLGRMS